MVSNVGTKAFFAQEKRPVNTAKVIAQIWGALVGLSAGMPEFVRESIVAVVILWSLDTASGYILAGMEGRMRSKTLRHGAIKKFLQYFLLLSAAGVVAWLAHNHLVVMPFFGLVIMVEATSIVETVYKMEQGGAKMPAGLRDMVRRMGRYIAVSTEDAPPAKPEEKE